MTGVCLPNTMPAIVTTRLLVVGALCMAWCGCRPAPTDVSPEAAKREAELWRIKHEIDYRRDWVTIAGLHFLHDGPQTAGRDPASDIVLPASAPERFGTFTLAAGDVRFEPAAGSAVTRNGEPVATPVMLVDDSHAEPDELVGGGVRLVVHLSGTRRSLRVWEADGPIAREFLGFRWFEIEPEYRVVGRFVADTEPRRVRVPNTFGDIDEYLTEGVVEFTLKGERLSLRPFTTRPKRFYFVFRDGSSGQETYAAARFLYADLRDDGTAVLDFNQAYNPPCAFNPYTTCPLPLPENRMTTKILAGERAYPVHVEPPGS